MDRISTTFRLLLLFILLGTTLAQANNTKPKAVISNSLGTYVIEPGQTITFDGRASYDLDGGGIASYRWYENGSGSHSSTSATFVKTYYSYGTFALKLRVTDHENTNDEKTVTIQVRPSVAGSKYYITDHLGSVRSTVNHLGQVVGQEDFWSYGLTMPGRSWNNGNAYDRYKFTGVERDSEGGLDLDAFGSRIYDPELGLFLGVDRFHHKYPSNTPYHYALNQPINNVDINGDSVYVVIDFDAVGGLGHVALLIQNKDGGWGYWSKNGTNQSSGYKGEEDKEGGDDLGDQIFDSPGKFMKEYSDYDMGFVIPTDKEGKQDERIANQFLIQTYEPYHVLNSSCLTAIEKALEYGGISIDSGKSNNPLVNSIPVVRFFQLARINR